MGRTIGSNNSSTAVRVSYDNSASSLLATNIQAAIDEVAAGIILSSDYHAGIDTILADETVTVAARKQMHVHGTLENSGLIIANGRLIIFG